MWVQSQDNIEEVCLEGLLHLPHDFKDAKYHYSGSGAGTITGVLYRGDAKTKYSKPNSPTVEHYHMVTPYDFSLIMQLPNQEEASQFMLH